MVGAALALLLAATAAVAAPPPEAAPAPDAATQLAAVRRQCIAAAADLQRREQVVRLLGHAVDLVGSDLAGQRRGLTESRLEQAELLGELERVTLHPPDGFVALPQTPLARARGEVLRQAIAPALRTEAHALSGAIERIAALKTEIATRQKELAAARDELAGGRAHLADLTRQRLVLEHQLLPEDIGEAASLAKLGQAKNVDDLIKRADGEEQRRDRELLARVRRNVPKQAAAAAAAAVDPTRPVDLRSFDPPASRLTPPVAGNIGRAFGAPAPDPNADPDDKTTTASTGLTFEAATGATVVAPFDGRVVYAAPFGNFGLVLIIRHGDLYHSLLAGLGRVDVRVDDWVLAGEPVGAMPDKPGAGFYFELRREGRPVDPQPWLGARGEDRSSRGGDQKVSE